MEAIRIEGDDILIDFLSATDRTYSLERSDTLEAGSWQPIMTAIPGTGGVVRVMDENILGHARRFYRVALEL